jgi:hypothetical protein
MFTGHEALAVSIVYTQKEIDSIPFSKANVSASTEPWNALKLFCLRGPPNFVQTLKSHLRIFKL